MSYVDIRSIESFSVEVIDRILDLLQSVSIQINKYDDRKRKTTTNYLSTLLKQSNLRKLESNIKN